MEIAEPSQKDPSNLKRRSICSYYREIENRINEGKDDIAEASSEKFIVFMNEVEDIHQHVMKPREQVADAEALLKLTHILAASVKSHSMGGITPAEFISILIKKFGQDKVFSHNVSWPCLGAHVSTVFMKGSGCRTMIGPMKKEFKQRKSVIRAKRERSAMKTLPKEFKNTKEMVSDTDQNIYVMFEILKMKKKVKLESLVLNRHSFAQTVENLFALSFLVKDGRVHMDLDEAGSHFIAPRNGPNAEEIKSGAARSHHFVFILDFDDWKLMKISVQEEEELMPRRYALIQHEIML